MGRGRELEEVGGGCGRGSSRISGGIGGKRDFLERKLISEGVRICGILISDISL